MSTYGREFSAIYNYRWAFWGRKMWPFLSKYLRRNRLPAASWLDLCCGAGSLLKFVAGGRCRAIGLDISPSQLRHARRNAPEAKLIRGDVRDFELAERFDVITCLMDSLNYLTTKADLLKAFRNARAHLAEGGVFVFDMNTYDGLARHWSDRSSASNEPTSMMIFETAFDPRTAIGELTITGFRKDGRQWRRFRERHVERGYRPEEIQSLLARAGLEVVHCCDEQFRRRTTRPSRVICVCRK